MNVHFLSTDKVALQINMTSEDSPDPSQHWHSLRLPPGLNSADLHVQVSQRLSVLDVVQRAIDKERSELAMAWNRTLPVNQLPNELLISIFAHFANAISTREPHVYLTRLYPNTRWTKILIICHHWRDVACASPALWRAILMRSTAYTQRALALSTPATIDAHFVTCKTILKNLKLLKPHTQRLRSLSFEAIGTAWKSAAITLLQNDIGMSALETLELPLVARSTQEPRPDDDFADIHLTPERFPCLRSLTVKLTVAPENVQVYARLRKLSLDTCRCDFSFQHFLDALAASTKLESLRLASILQRIQGDWVQRIAPRQRPLSLRHLKSLALLDHPPIYSSRFLSYVVLSPTASVRICGSLGDIAEQDVTETVSALLPRNAAVNMPALAAVPDVSVNVYDTVEYCLIGSIEPLQQWSPQITFLIHSSGIPYWREASSHHGARDLLSVFGSAPLTTLGFTADCGDITAETWTEIFNRYPLLESLDLSAALTTETAFAGLMNAAPTPDSPSVPCPGLRSVRVGGPFFRDAVDVALQCLRDRADKGHRLGTLTMELYGDEGDDTLFEEIYVPQLREVAIEAYCSCGQ